MRVLKFRVYNKKTKSWIHGPHERADLDGVNLFGEHILFGEFIRGVSIEDLNEIVALQYTGFNDKNGKNIFEGDFVEYDGGPIQEWNMYPGKHICEITWVQKDGGYCLISKKFCWTFTNDVRKKLCVIGNVFDTPELIK